jgi:hypothetical protein
MWVLIPDVILRSPDLRRCELSHLVSSAFCLKTRVISAAAASGVPSECSACWCARRPARTALRHVTATEVGGALVPKLIDELLRSELMCLNQAVRERFRRSN